MRRVSHRQRTVDLASYVNKSTKVVSESLKSGFQTSSFVSSSLNEGNAISKEEANRFIGNYAYVPVDPGKMFTRTRKELIRKSNQIRGEKILINLSRYSLQAYFKYVELRRLAKRECNIYYRLFLRNNVPDWTLVFIESLIRSLKLSLNYRGISVASKSERNLISRLSFLRRLIRRNDSLISDKINAKLARA